MKKVILILAVATMFASCGHDHNKDKVLGNIHDVFKKELNDSVKKFSKVLLTQRKKLIDSMRVVARRAPEGKGWFSAREMGLPPGTIMEFNPDELDYKGPGPFLIIIKGSDGRQSINNIDRRKWLMFKRGDILK